MISRADQEKHERTGKAQKQSEQDWTQDSGTPRALATGRKISRPSQKLAAKLQYSIEIPRTATVVAHGGVGMLLGMTSPLEGAVWGVALLCFMGATWFVSWRLPALLVAGNRFS